MTVRQIIAESLAPLFEVDEPTVDALPDALLAQANAITELFPGFISNIDAIFAEDGSIFITQVRAAINELTNLGIDIVSILPNSQNILLALQFTNALTLDQLDSEIDAMYQDFIFYENPVIDGVFGTSGTPVRVYSYHNSVNTAESFHYIDFRSNAADLDNEELDRSAPLNPIIVFAICKFAGSIAGSHWIVSTNHNEVKRASLLRYHALLSGFLLTAPVMSPTYLGVEGIADTVHGGGSYEQFFEPFEMLSEINSRTKVIDAFLSAYHSLENYMIRTKIVEVERAHTQTTLFGMRQFRGIYSAVDKTENDQLKNLFKVCKNLVIGGVSVEAYAVSRISSLTLSLGGTGLANPTLVSFFGMLALGPPTDLNNVNARLNILSNLIYKIRCSIVHNKETEYHLSNRELKEPAIYKILTELCIPLMRRIAFGLPAVTVGNPILYSRKELLLY